MQKIYFLLFMFVVLVLSSCLEVETYPNEPSLSAASIVIQGDSAILNADFIDGDGNFGLDESDTGGVFSDCLHQYNFFADYQE
jgi:hypothetical protein